MRMGKPRLRAHWRALAGGAVCLVIAVALLAFIDHQSQPQPNDVLRSFTSSVTYPAGSRVCSGPMTATCAQQAAMRAGQPIAWLAPFAGFTVDGAYLLEIPGGPGQGGPMRSVFIEDLHSSAALVAVDVGEASPAGGAPGLAARGAATASITHHFDLGTPGGGTFDYHASWNLGGRVATLTVSSQGEGGSAQRTKAVLDRLLARIQVASPPV